MTDWFSDRYDETSRLVAVGDFNIAPFENDVWSHKQLLKVISHTPAETTRLQAMRDSINWIDVREKFISLEEKAYTWWSYRSPNWTKNNRGRRLDHIWATQPLKEHLDGFNILKDYRSAEKPSDHVPVVVDLKF